MASITIRNVPDETRAELAARAARSGRSMQEFLRLRLIELASDVDVDDVIASARERTTRLGTRLSAAAIIAARDADRP